MKPVIAIVGRPNVGKSTLFNVLTQSRDALVADYPGLTRDRKYGHGTFDDSQFIVVDTGGLSGDSEQLDQHMAAQTRYAVNESSVVLFLVDARDGLTAADEDIASQLRRSGKKVLLVVNKTDGINADLVISEFYALGLGDPIRIAAAHNRGIKSLLDTVLAPLTEEQVETDQEHGIKVAFVGRPNVGKSTLVNRVLGEDRVVVFDMPGTTRDSIYIPFERDNKRYTLIDTAGVRRRRSVSEAVEKFSVIKTMQAIEESHVVVMMMDAQKEIADQDLHLLGFILEAGRALVLVINKWDGLDDYQKDRIKADVDQQLSFIRYAETYYVSALHGSNVGRLYAAINRAYESATRNLSTARLTRILEQAIAAHPPPLIRGRRLKLRYAHQGGVNPPRIIIHGNQTEQVPASYQRYLTNFFIEAINVVGTPVKIEFKTGANPFADRKNKLSKRQQFRRARMIQHIKRRERKRKKH
ncbi:MAG: ribosome biogenesis GTPase Der [Gammaproteobacteria bacterium]|nr:ribosome biogenesis GTPase Der [Gammaproteobacteria bacterium]NNJ96381.1 ribosome biogenesis GTPase Der [Gammaproteobacteria bacterium]